MDSFDLIVIGAGPAGQKAAIQGAKADARVLLVDQAIGVGGECVHRGTIPSKTLRQTAIHLGRLRALDPELIEPPFHRKLSSLLSREAAVRRAHEGFLERQLARNLVERLRGRARFQSPEVVEVSLAGGGRTLARAEAILIATGSRPRTPAGIPVDHEQVLDSDSILSLLYLPRTLAVLGGGVIACEYASIFAGLGVEVTVIDRGERPLPFLDPDLTTAFTREFERRGSRILSGRSVEDVTLDPAGVRTRLAGGEEVVSEKVLAALGRQAQVTGLDLETAGVALSPQGWIAVDGQFRTSSPRIFAAGDVIGPPALAAVSMEQGRLAARHALRLPQPIRPERVLIPVGVYTVPELSSVGLSEAEARARGCDILVGRAPFHELARGQIAGEVEGLLKLVVDAGNDQVLGAQAAGEGAAELIHLAQVAILGNLPSRTFVDHIFNFPTLAEAFRVAALHVEAQARERTTARRAA